MTESDRKILARACDLCWHEIVWHGNYLQCACDLVYHQSEQNEMELHVKKSNPTFSSPDDWELVRVKVVVPNVDNYLEYFQDEYEHAWYAFAERMITSSAATLCQDAVDFIKSRPDLFPWVREMEGEVMVQREANTMKLLTIALWFDSERKRGRWGDSKGTEVQDDLRAIAMDYAALEQRCKELEKENKQRSHYIKSLTQDKIEETNENAELRKRLEEVK